MALSRYVGVLDLAVLTVVAVAVFLPAREMYASNVIEGDEASRFALALAEARTIARPDDGRAAEDFARRLGKANLKDWAIEAAVTASERAKESPTRWRALVAASVAYVDKLEVVAALDYADRALAACEAAHERGDAAACPSSEEVRMRLYHQHLEAGVKSGIDPKVDAAGFRRAANAALRQIYIGGRDSRPISTGPDNATGSAGSAAGSGTPESTGSASP
jgi:hypothetical protein